jgi:hypothetical protein
MLGVPKHTGTRRLPDGSYRLLNLGEIAESSGGFSEATPTDTLLPANIFQAFSLIWFVAHPI